MSKAIEDIITKMTEATGSGDLEWEKSLDQDCCSTSKSYMGSDYIICIFNEDDSGNNRDEFIIFGPLSEHGFYDGNAHRFDPGDRLYEELKQLTELVDSRVKIID